MRVPYLKSWDRIPIKVFITDGIDEDGSPNVVETYEGKCNYNESGTTVKTSDGQLVRLNGVITIGCDIAPEVPVITGYVEIAGKQWNIYRGSRPRNPDGSVHHTRLELV